LKGKRGGTFPSTLKGGRPERPRKKKKKTLTKESRSAWRKKSFVSALKEKSGHRENEGKAVVHPRAPGKKKNKRDIASVRQKRDGVRQRGFGQFWKKGANPKKKKKKPQKKNQKKKKTQKKRKKKKNTTKKKKNPKPLLKQKKGGKKISSLGRCVGC